MGRANLSLIHILKMDKKEEEKLLREAEKVLPRAYAPYSNYRVAAAISTEDGKIFTGEMCIRDSSYG